MSRTICYEIFYNADMTEGRGPMSSMGLFHTHADVEKAVADKSYWIMGVTHNHEVYEIRIPHDKSKSISRRMVFGYRGKQLHDAGISKASAYGWLDLRDLSIPADDPEYKEYLRLNAKFGG